MDPGSVASSKTSLNSPRSFRARSRAASGETKSTRATSGKASMSPHCRGNGVSRRTFCDKRADLDALLNGAERLPDVDGDQTEEAERKE